MKILRGDNDLISPQGAQGHGTTRPMPLGDDVEKTSDDELADAAEKTKLFARLSPAHKHK